jgi:hypothetical protein
VPHSTLTPADAETLGQPGRRFIADRVIPLEQEAFAAGVDHKLRIQLQQLAHDAGVLAPKAPAEYADIRAFRIYDGPSEAHRAAIARRAVARIQRASA